MDSIRQDNPEAKGRVMGQKEMGRLLFLPLASALILDITRAPDLNCPSMGALET